MNGEKRKERETVKVSDNFFVYRDDPYKLLASVDGVTTWIRVVSREYSEQHFTTQEQDCLFELRSLYSVFPENMDKEAIAKVVVKYFSPMVQYFPDVEDERQGKVEQKKDEKKEFTVQPGSTLALAKTAGIPEEMANLFFMSLNGNAYIKVAGLQYMAGKIGYRRIEITDSCDEKSGTWSAEARIYPRVDAKTLETLAKLAPDVQKDVYADLSKPTNGIGTANRSSVQNTRMLPFLREMAQTRALGRALRSYTGYGSTVYEELPESQLEGD